jgi:hypothetical protein
MTSSPQADDPDGSDRADEAPVPGTNGATPVARRFFSVARDALAVERVFGTPIERGDTTVVPVAAVMTGGGFGNRPDEPEEGGGFGLWARPLGVYVIDSERVRFRPVVDPLALTLAASIALPLLLRVLRHRFARAKP